VAGALIIENNNRATLQDWREARSIVILKGATGRFGRHCGRRERQFLILKSATEPFFRTRG
jgi:hypothetical protein